jgi:hypothetical protein
MFGYEIDNIEKFDPEIRGHLACLNDCLWESDSYEHTHNVDLSENINFDSLMETAISECLKRLHTSRKIAVIYGHHGGIPKKNILATSGKETTPKKTKQKYFHEIHFDYSVPALIERYEIDEQIEENLLDYNHIKSLQLDYSVRLWLKDSLRITDLFSFYRGWLICSEKLTHILKKYTAHIQILPIILYNSITGKEEMSENYYIVNLYEKVNCISGKWLTMRAPGSTALTFNPSTGFKVLLDRVNKRDIFRISVYDYRLLLSQRVREEIEQNKLSGISWIKREIE